MNSFSLWLKRIVLVVSAGYLAMYVVLALLRISYPFELEWMEGSMVDHVQRVLDGQSLHVAPRMEFVPFLYPPLYFYLAAGIAAITGSGFLPLRLISFAASLGALALIILLVKRETAKWTLGLLAAGVFAATYRVCGAWLDIGRVDSLLLFLLLAAVYVLRVHETRRGALSAGLLLALAMLTKQTALLVALPLFLYLFFARRDLLLWAVVPFALVAGVTMLALTLHTDGWFWFYTVSGPAHHAIQFSLLPYVLAHDLLVKMGIALGAAVLYVFVVNGERKTRLFYGMFVLGMLAASLLPRLKAGGFSNHLMPVYAALAILLSLPVFRLTSRLSPNLIYAACLLQLLILVYNPARCIPTKADRQAGEALVAKIAAEHGDVLVLSHGYLSALAGKKPTANYIAVTDVLSSHGTTAQVELLGDLRSAIQTQRYSALILDDDDPLAWQDVGILDYYEKSQKAVTDPHALWPVSGWPTRPEWILKPKQKAESRG